jgi:hypothetical protein
MSLRVRRRHLARRGRLSRALAAVVAVLAIGATAASPSAHHAFSAEFDANKPIKLQGVVTKFELINPHSWIYLDVKADDGTVTNWAIELGAPNAMVRRGWRKDSIMEGTELVIEGFLAKNGKAIANGRFVRFKDGKELFVGSSSADAPNGPK